jgi:hypothetical protein
LRVSLGLFLSENAEAVIVGQRAYQYDPGFLWFFLQS